MNTFFPRVLVAIGSDVKRQVIRFRDNCDAQSLVEFAACMPPLLLIVTGIMTFGIALNNYLALTNAVSISARQLSISRGQTMDPCSLAYTAISNAAPNLKKTNITMTLVLNGTTYSGTTCTSASTSTGAAGNLVLASPATVTATYPCSLKVYGVNLSPSCNLQAQVTEAVE